MRAQRAEAIVPYREGAEGLVPRFNAEGGLLQPINDVRDEQLREFRIVLNARITTLALAINTLIDNPPRPTTWEQDLTSYKGILAGIFILPFVTNPITAPLAAPILLVGFITNRYINTKTFEISQRIYQEQIDLMRSTIALYERMIDVFDHELERRSYRSILTNIRDLLTNPVFLSFVAVVTAIIAYLLLSQRSQSNTISGSSYFGKPPPDPSPRGEGNPAPSFNP